MDYSNLTPYASHYQASIDMESELRGLSRTASMCSSHKYKGPSHNCPNKNCSCGHKDKGNCSCVKCVKVSNQKGILGSLFNVFSG